MEGNLTVGFYLGGLAAFFLFFRRLLGRLITGSVSSSQASALIVFLRPWEQTGICFLCLMWG